MSTPMYDLPDHLSIGVDADGKGPVMQGDPGFVGMVCWCGTKGCEEAECGWLFINPWFNPTAAHATYCPCVRPVGHEGIHVCKHGAQR